MKSTYWKALLICLSLVQVAAYAGGLEKGMESLDKKDYYGAKKQFEKILYKDPVGGNYGLSLVYFREPNPFYDIRLSLKYCVKADSAFHFSMDRERERLAEFGIRKQTIEDHHRAIGLKAYDDLMENPTDSSITLFIEDFRFSEKFRDVISLRNERAFEKTRQEDSFQAYRQFIIEYPGASERPIADSLYALRFFEEKTSSGSIEGYRQFVNEFPANPYSDQAYDTIFTWVNGVKSKEAYKDFIFDFPRNKNTDKAWRALNLIFLRNYSQVQMKGVIKTYPSNPYNDLLEKELALMGVKRFIMKDSLGSRVVGIDGKVYGEVYQEIFEFKEGLARVLKDGAIGFIDKLGEEVIPPQFADAYDFRGGLAVVENEGLFGAVDRFGGMAIPYEYEELGNLSDGYMAYEKDGISGFIDFNGTPCFRRTFDYASDFQDGYAVVRVEGLYGAIDTTGSYSIPALYDWVEENKYKQSRVRKGDLFGVYVHGEQLSVPVEYEMIGELSAGLRSVALEGKMGFVNQKAELVIPLIYDFDKTRVKEMVFEGNQTVVYSNAKAGLLDIAGEFLLAPKYDEIINTGRSIVQFRSKGKWGHIRSDGERIGGMYDEVFPYQQGLSKVKKDDSVCLVDVNGKPTMPCDYLDLNPVKDTELIIVTTEDGQGLITRDSEVILESVYDKIEPLNIRFARLSKDGQEELLDMTENESIWSSSDSTVED